MREICSYLVWARIENLTLNFTVTDSDFAHCMEIGDSLLYTVSYGTDELWHLGGSEFLH